MKHTANVNSPHVIFVLMVIVLIVVVGIYIGETIRDLVKKQASKRRIRRDDDSIFTSVKEARRRDFR